MKRIILGLFSLVVTSLVLSSTAMAGMNYIQYRETFEASKGAPSAPASEGTRFYHQSKYLREQEPARGTVYPSNAQPQRFINKYDRSNWAPQQ